MKTQFGFFDENFNVIKTCEVDINTINSGDPLAFAYGVSRGIQVRKMAATFTDSKKIHGSNFSELSPEYLRGFLLGYKGFLVPEGTKFRKGQEQSFFHMDKKIDPNTLNK